MRCRIAVLCLLLSAVCLPVRGQWECALYGGVGLPALSGDNAPPLRTSLATALRGGYALGESWLLTAEVGQLQQLRQEHPNLEALILDTAFHVKRYQFIPIMLGVGYRLPLSRPANHNITFQIALGTHFRYIHCQQQTSPMVVDDRGESGWGLPTLVYGNGKSRGWRMETRKQESNLHQVALAYRRLSSVLLGNLPGI